MYLPRYDPSPWSTALKGATPRPGGGAAREERVQSQQEAVGDSIGALVLARHGWNRLRDPGPSGTLLNKHDGEDSDAEVSQDVDPAGLLPSCGRRRIQSPVRGQECS
jgi:hypothetical protein